MIKIKTARQIEGIRTASKLLVEVLTELEKRVEPGVSTADLDHFAREHIGAMGARPAFLGYMGFPAPLAAERNHGYQQNGFPLVPGRRRVEYRHVAGVVVHTNQGIRRMPGKNACCVFHGITQFGVRFSGRQILARLDVHCKLKRCARDG